MTSPYPTNPPYVMGSSRLTVFGLGGSLETVFGMGNPPIGFAPSNLTGLVVWHDATQILGITSGTSLSAWTDISGNGNHVTQASAVSQPIYVTNVQNGLPIVRFDGLSRFLQKTFTLNQPVTVFTVFSVQTTAAQVNHMAFDGGGSQTMSMNLGGTWPTTNIPIINAGASLTCIDSLKTNGVFYTYTSVFSGTASAVYINGSQKTSGNAGSNNPAGVTLGTLGTGAPANAGCVDIAEFLVYNRVVSTAEQLSVETYLRTKWGTA